MGIATSYVCKIAKKLKIEMIKVDNTMYYTLHNLITIQDHLFENRQGCLKRIHNYIKKESDRFKKDYSIPVKKLQYFYELSNYEFDSIIADITERDNNLYEDDCGKLFYKYIEK